MMNCNLMRKVIQIILVRHCLYKLIRGTTCLICMKTNDNMCCLLIFKDPLCKMQHSTVLIASHNKSRSFIIHVRVIYILTDAKNDPKKE